MNLHFKTFLTLITSILTIAISPYIIGSIIKLFITVKKTLPFAGIWGVGFLGIVIGLAIIAVIYIIYCEVYDIYKKKRIKEEKAKIAKFGRTPN